MNERYAKCHPAFTLVEVMLVVGMVAVVALAVTGIVYSSYQDWQVVSRRSNVLQNGQAAIDFMVRSLRQAKDFSAISPPSDPAGFITFTSVDDLTEQFKLNTGTGELEYGDPCSSLSALTGPVNSLTFTYYDIDGDSLDEEEVSDIRSIVIQAEFADAEDPSLTFTLSGRVFVPTDDQNPPCLLGWWKLNDGFGLTATDSSGNGYHGSLENMDGTEWTTGILGGALQLDGNGDYIDSSIDSDEVIDNVTFAAWFSSDDAGSIGDDYLAQRFVSQACSGINSRLALGINNNKIGTYWYDTGHNVGEGTTTLSGGVWYHTALTYDGSDIKIYLDGAEENSFSESSMTAPSSDKIEIAQHLDGSRLFDGILDDVRIYRCALNPTEIADLAACLRYREFTEAKAASDTTSITIDTPGGTNEGDLLIAAVATDGSSSSSLVPPGGQGWTQIDIGNRSAKVTLGAWWKNAGASESPTHQFAWSGDQQAYAWMMRFTGHDSSDPVNFWAADGEASDSPTSPAVTPTVDNTIILRLGAFDDADITVDDPGLSGHATVTMDASASSGGSSGVAILGSWTSGLTHTAEPGSNRLLVLTAHVEDNDADMTLDSVTYGGWPMTKVIEEEIQEGSDRAYVVAYILDETGIAAAVGDTFFPYWSSTPDQVGYSSVFLENVDQAAPTGPSNSKGHKLQTTISTNQLATNNGDIVILAATAGNDNDYSVNNGFTEAVELSITSADAVAGYKQATGVNETPSITHSNPDRQVLIGFVVQTDDGGGSSEGTVSGGAGYVSQADAGGSGTSNFSLTDSEEARTLTIAIAPAP